MKNEIFHFVNILTKWLLLYYMKIPPGSIIVLPYFWRFFWA